VLLLIPVTLAQQKFALRHGLTFVCIALGLVSGILLPKIENNHNMAWFIGCCLGTAETLVIVFPLMKIRHFFTEFEKKIFSSGAFLAIQLATKWALN